MDLDDLLEDVPDKTVKSKLPPKKSKTEAVISPKLKDDDGWGELEDNKPVSTAGFAQDSGRQASKGPSSNRSKGGNTSFGFGGENGLKKEKMKPND